MHHIVARGNQRQPIFVDDEDRAAFLDLLVEARERYRCFLLAYCLMSNHVHLVVQDGEGELSRALRHVIGVYAQRFNRRHDRVGHLFEQRFWNSLIEVDQYLAVAVEYVHRNPLEAGMVEELADYQWSSFPAYIGRAPCHPALEPNVVLAHYGNDRYLLRSSTESRVRDQATEIELRRRHPAPVLGSDGFVASMVGSAPPCDETRSSRRKATSQSISIGRIALAVAECAGADVAALHVSVRGRHNDLRSLAIHLAHQAEGIRLADIADYFDVSVSAVGMCSHRFAGRMADHPRLRVLAERVLDDLTHDASEKLGRDPK